MMSVACPVCLANAHQQLVRLRDVPVMMHHLYATAEGARRAPLARLDLNRCRSCGFVWNEAFDSAKLQYDGSYENNQGHSKVFRDHMLGRVEEIMKLAPDGQPLNYLEVGCGQGTFLDYVVENAGACLHAADGFDPAYRGRASLNPSVRFHSDYFDRRTAARLSARPNVVVSRHTIEHVPDPVAFLRSIREGLGEDSQAVIFLETPDVDWIIANWAIQDFFYEHCSIFTADALKFALHRAGFQDANVEAVFGGQYLWASARAGDPEEITVDRCLELVRSPADAFAERWRERVRSAKASGRVALWGAGAKGVTFALLVDPAGELVDHVIDINPGKQGHFLPVCGVPVVSPEAAGGLKPSTIFVMNPIYLAEIAEAAAAAGVFAELVPID